MTVRCPDCDLWRPDDGKGKCRACRLADLLREALDAGPDGETFNAWNTRHCLWLDRVRKELGE